jgi:hypothetical protein
MGGKNKNCGHLDRVVAQVVQPLPSLHEALSSLPSTGKKKKKF